MATLDAVRTWLASVANILASGAWTQPVPVPAWGVVAVAALLAVLLLGRLFRPYGYDTGGGGGLWRFALIVLVGFVAWRGFQYLEETQVQSARLALGERLSRAIISPVESNPLLACVNGVTNPDLRAACERTVFAKPENAAAAVSLIRDRLELLTLASLPASGLGPDDSRTVRLRRALESDDFGLVAYVLTETEQCRPESCAPLDLFKDAEKIKANMAARTFETLVEKQSAIWTPGRGGPFGFRQHPSRLDPALSGPPGPVTSGTMEMPPPGPTTLGPGPSGTDSLGPPTDLSPAAVPRSAPPAERAAPPPAAAPKPAAPAPRATTAAPTAPAVTAPATAPTAAPTTAPKPPPQPVARPATVPRPQQPAPAMAPVQPAVPRLPPPTSLTLPPMPDEEPAETPSED
ncbi:hypothetical protein [Blastochloris sulfoviridis]|uniref:Uncharacterized protein n=1 Tax=Blastochloris sulfoviridis TaxID=50712 RepID=A0A5M6I1E8_9HYPH|nr:hypothetical protein [Blastochloris sulfoviridis]KAA5602000.1 hypothetical protein F1193_07580 [Blastochloris sulfoviridis]